MFVGYLLAVTLTARFAAAEDPDLVLYLPLDETSGATTFSDASGYDNHGECTNCPTLGVPGKVGTAAQFDGADDVIAVADAEGRLRTNSFTISLWLQWNALGTANVQFITAKGLEHLELHTGGAAGVNGLRFIPAGGTTILDVANALDAGWNHVVATYDGSAASVYVNGILRGSRTGIAGGADLTTDANSLRLGRRLDGSFPLAGVIDDVRVYRRVLSAEEINDLAILFPPLPPSSFDAPGAPTTDAGHMPTLQELYDYLTTGATQAFQEPATGPAAGTMKTVQQIYAALKARFDLITVTAADVRNSKRYFSTSPWRIRTGTMPTRTLSDTSITVDSGYYAATDLVTIDSDLSAAKIKCGITLFGIEGTNGLPECVAQTGQTDCWDTNGSSIPCAGTGQDGAYQMGCGPVVGPGYGSNFGGYNRTSFTCTAGFTDNGDGTVTDNLTGLIWLKNANCFQQQHWTQALSNANTLADGNCGLSDGSVAGDWRLPNLNELRSLFDPGWSINQYLPAGHPFTNVQYYYWSSTSYAPYPNNAWGVNLGNGYAQAAVKTDAHYVWVVR